MEESYNNNNNINNSNEYNQNNENNENQNENNYYEKPLHGSQLANSNIGASTNKFDNSKLDIQNNMFTFISGKSHIFKLDQTGEIDYIYQNLKQQQCKLMICILIKDDTYFNNKLLEKTFEGLKSNIRDLQQISIDPENILICVFFNESKNSSIFNDEDKNELQDKDEYILAEKTFSFNELNINVHCITKMNYLSDMEILKLYYTFILKNIRIENGIIFSSIITAGVVPIDKSLINLTKIAFNARNQHAIVVPILEDEQKPKLFSKIKKYERFHFNLYNMNFYNMTASVPICSLFNVMAIGNQLFKELFNYYNNRNFNLNETIDYHDYNLSLTLFVKNCKIIYYNENPFGRIVYSDLTEDPISDYKNTWVQRYSGYYGNFFSIIRTFLDCNACNIGQKIFLFFHIIGLMVEFIYPSLSTMVIYTIFYEAFKIFDRRPAAFCTLIYLFILISSGACSLVSNNTQRMPKSNLIFFFFMEIYYLFILICSIIAMDNIKKNKDKNPYKFNTAAITCIIIFTFIPAISPMLLRISKVFENFVEMLLYLILGAPSSSSFFHISKILNAGEMSGGYQIKERKGIIILAYVLINLFFGSMTFFNYNRQKRVDAVMGFGIFYLIYTFFKCLAISINLISGGKAVYIPANLEEDIRNGFSPNSYNLKGSNNYYENNDNNYNNVGESNNNYDNNYNDNFNNNYNNNEFPSKNEVYENNYDNNDNNNNNDYNNNYNNNYNNYNNYKNNDYNNNDYNN